MQKLRPQLRDDCVQFVSARYDLVTNNEVTKALKIHFGNVVDLCHQNLREKVLCNAPVLMRCLCGIERKRKPRIGGSGAFTGHHWLGVSLAMHKQGEQKNDRERNAKKPGQRASPKAHNNLLPAICQNNAAVPMKFLEHCERKRVS